jgi:predicted SnoaL-like aldol condensation-catalyzing enzyme
VGVKFGQYHHNPFFAAGFHALKKGMTDAHRQFPNTTIDIKHVLGDDDLVAVHSNVVMTPGEQGVAVVHLFRFNGDRIVEMWDVGQPIPPDSPNTDGVF